MRGLFRDSNMNAIDIEEEKEKRFQNFGLLVDFFYHRSSGAFLAPHLMR
jgi:hypothetical protein